ncbi:MAG: class A beta-lactamase-related serine hydrolase [Sphaerobacteraceae bacterium]|nr:MAG: class A beta-lactamase-related serine hydrolase [Sphaerobacteraceae bacterium]
MSNSPAELKQVAEQLLSEWQVPGIAVGILQNGEVETYGFGQASVETGFPMRPDTVLQIGSISKIFTSTLAMALVDAGKLDLDTPVVAYVPDLQLQDKEAQQTLTMRHLLTHTSGLYGDWFQDFGLGDDALGKALANIHTLRQISRPGEVWSYCNSGFYLAGAVIERLTGKTFEQAMADYVFEPLGMEKATFFAHEAITWPTAVGHNIEDGELAVARRYPLPRNVNAAGGIITDVGEMLRFAQLHVSDGNINGNQVLSAESVKAMQNDETKAAVMADYYGLAWALRDRDGKRLVGHGGSTNGFRAYLCTVPEENFAIVMLTNGNLGTAVYHRLEDWALEHYCGIKNVKPEAVELSNEQLEHLTGYYEQPIHKITLSAENGGLRLDVVDRSPLADASEEKPQDPKWAYPTSDRDFIIQGGPDDGQHVDFVFDEDGNPRYFRYHGRVSEPVR